LNSYKKQIFFCSLCALKKITVLALQLHYINYVSVLLEENVQIKELNNRGNTAMDYEKDSVVSNVTAASDKPFRFNRPSNSEHVF
jgi:hypothetical protein